MSGPAFGFGIGPLVPFWLFWAKLSRLTRVEMDSTSPERGAAFLAEVGVEDSGLKNLVTTHAQPRWIGTPPTAVYCPSCTGTDGGVGDRGCGGAQGR